MNGKNNIEFTLKALKINYVKEYRFDAVRRFKFDFAIVDKKIAIEYEGIMSNKARHTTVTGFTNDCEKYNLATCQGWRILRYTVLNVNQIESDLNKIL